MSHILIKWKSDSKWDVYPVRALVDEEIACSLCTDPTFLDYIRDREHLVKWDSKEPAAPATLLAIGAQMAMEKKRSKLAGRYEELHPAKKRCCSHVQENEQLRIQVAELRIQVAELQEANARHLERLAQAETGLDLQRMAKRLKRSIEIVEELSSRPAAAAAVTAPNVVPAVLVDIGSNVLVDQHLLNQLKMKEKAPGPFARGLLCIVFTEEERVGKSLFGKQSNSHKEELVKPALDPVRVKAVIAYACEMFGNVEKAVKASLSSLLSRRP